MEIIIEKPSDDNVLEGELIEDNNPENPTKVSLVILAEQWCVHYIKNKRIVEHAPVRIYYLHLIQENPLRAIEGPIALTLLLTEGVLHVRTNFLHNFWAEPR